MGKDLAGRHRERWSPHRRWPRGTGVVAIVLGFVVVAAGAGSLLTAREAQRLEQNARAYVGSLVDSRAAELNRWLFERYGDADVASRDPVIGGAIPGNSFSHRAYTGFALAR